jgi:hypothetical protein
MVFQLIRPFIHCRAIRPLFPCLDVTRGLIFSRGSHADKEAKRHVVLSLDNNNGLLGLSYYRFGHRSEKYFLEIAQSV